MRQARRHAAHAGASPLPAIAGPATFEPMPANGERAPLAAAGLARHAARVPADAAEKGVAIAARSGPPGLTITVSAERLSAPDLFLEWPVAAGQRRPDLPKPAVRLSGDGREAEFRVSVHPPLVRPGTRLSVTVTDGAAAVEALVTVESGEP